jgi:hypothetical protein
MYSREVICEYLLTKTKELRDQREAFSAQEAEKTVEAEEKEADAVDEELVRFLAQEDGSAAAQRAVGPVKGGSKAKRKRESEKEESAKLAKQFASNSDHRSLTEKADQVYVTKRSMLGGTIMRARACAPCTPNPTSPARCLHRRPVPTCGPHLHGSIMRVSSLVRAAECPGAAAQGHGSGGSRA